MMREDDFQKIKIIDRYITSMTLEEIKDKFGEAMAVDRLSGIAIVEGPIMNLYNDIALSRNDNQTLRTEIVALRQDFISLVKAFHMQSVIPFNQDLYTLKSKYGIY